MLFEDRKEAGQALAVPLMKYKNEAPVVLGLPLGGIPVGGEIAAAFDAPLDVAVARKISVPDYRNLAFGAIAPGGIRVLNNEVVRLLGLSEAEIDRIVKEEETDMNRLLKHYGACRKTPSLKERTVILVDDGQATGVMARAAIRAIRRQGPSRLVFASPVCPRDTALTLSPETDGVICLECPDDFGTAGRWYKTCEPISDEAIMLLLNEANARMIGRDRNRSEAA